MQRDTMACVFTLSLVGAVALGQGPARTAGDQDDAGVLRFSITDPQGAAIPGRLTFVVAGEQDPDLFPNTQADPDHLAVRRNVIYTLEGRGAVTVPPGEYTVYASRGLEWSIDSARVTVRPSGEAILDATLYHEVDTSGWVSGDFHLHTLTYSGHGDSNMNERIISLVGEGVEFAVATDHNHHTDYAPTIEHLHAHEHLSAVVGDEVSTPVGHFNAFPLSATSPTIPSRLTDANALFSIIRTQANEFGLRPVIQLNHPRWGDIDYFGRTGLDPVTGRPTTPQYSEDFDTIEIFNENEGWGYYRVGLDGVPTEQQSHSVLQDWFNLLNLGHRYAAVGNSDSHTVHNDMCGYPRNFVQMASDDPASVDVPELATSLRESRVFTTIGPFVEFSAGGVPMGGDAAATNGSVELAIRVQAASWVAVDRVKVIVNGDVVRVIEVPQTGDAVRLDTALTLPVRRDCWVSLLVEGDTSLSPIVSDQGRPILPLAVCNPVWIDADADGDVTCAADWATGVVGAAGMTDDLAHPWEHSGDSERAMLVLAAVETGFAKADDVVRMGLRDGSRKVRLAALRGAEQLGTRDLSGDLRRVWDEDGIDGYMRIAAMRALAACGGPDVGDRVLELIDRTDPVELSAYGSELDALLPGGMIREWSVVGYFPCDGPKVLEMAAYGPEGRADGAFEGVGGGQVSWRTMPTRDNGYLDLQKIDNAPGAFEGVIAYAQAWIKSDREQTVPFAMGSDDGAVVFVNGERLLTDLRDHSAQPMQNIGRMQLKKGWNRVLVKVANYGGGFGMYFRPIGEGLEVAAEQTR